MTKEEVEQNFNSKDKEVLTKGIEFLKGTFPEPFSGQERFINGSLITHYDPDNENVWSVINYIERLLNSEEK